MYHRHTIFEFNLVFSVVIVFRFQCALIVVFDKILIIWHEPILYYLDTTEETVLSKMGELASCRNGYIW